MKKIFPLVLIIAIMSLIIFSEPVKHTLGFAQQKAAPFASILEAIDGDFYEVSVLAWGKLNSKYMTVNELKETLAAIQGKYYNTQSVPKFFVEENYKSCEWNVKAAEGKAVQVILQTYQPTAKTPELTPESYLLMELAQTTNGSDAIMLKQEITDLYNTFKITPEISITYTVRVKGKITNTQGRAVIDRVSKILGLEDVQETFVADYYAVKGYSKEFPEKIILAGQRQNFNLVMRYNIADDYTYVIFGTPDIGGQD